MVNWKIGFNYIIDGFNAMMPVLLLIIGGLIAVALVFVVVATVYGLLVILFDWQHADGCRCPECLAKKGDL